MKSTKVHIKATYKIPNKIDTTLDGIIDEKIRSIGGDWYAQGLNKGTGIRDICFDLELSDISETKTNEAAKVEREDKLLRAVIALIKSHNFYTSREYRRDATYNQDSQGYKEEETIMKALQEFTGLDIMAVMGRYEN